MNKLVRLLMVAFVTIFTLDTAVATAPTTKTPANITSPVLVRSYYREEGTNGRDRCVSLWPRQYSPSAASPWLVNIKYWPTAETYSVMPGIWVPTLKFFWATDNAGHIKFRHESSPFWSDPIPLNPYGLNSQNAYAIEVTDSGTTVFVNGVGTIVRGGLIPLLPTTAGSSGWVTFSGLTASTAVWWRPLIPFNLVY